MGVIFLLCVYLSCNRKKTHWRIKLASSAGYGSQPGSPACGRLRCQTNTQRLIARLHSVKVRRQFGLNLPLHLHIKFQ